MRIVKRIVLAAAAVALAAGLIAGGNMYHHGRPAPRPVAGSGMHFHG